MKALWLSLLFFINFQNILAHDGKADGNCCPCPDSTTSETVSNLQAVSPRDLVDCPCLPGDLQESPSILKNRSFEPERTQAPSKDSKPLLHPEVGLASSVFKTLHEVTDEEYREALEVDNARNALEDKHNNDGTTPINLETIVIKSPDVYDMDTAGEESHQHEERCTLPIGKTLGTIRKEISSYRPTFSNPYLLNYDLIDQGFASSDIKDNIKAVPEFRNKIPNLKDTSDIFGDSIINKTPFKSPLNFRNINLGNILRHKNVENQASGNKKETEYDSDVSPTNINNVVQDGPLPSTSSQDCLNSNQETERLSQPRLRQNSDLYDLRLKKYDIKENFDTVEKLHAANIEYLSNKIKENNMKLRNVLESPKLSKLKNKHYIEVQMEPMKIDSKRPSLTNPQTNVEKSDSILESVSGRVIDKDILNDNLKGSNNIDIEDLEVMSNKLLEQSIKNENDKLVNGKNIPSFKSKQKFKISENDNFVEESRNKHECETTNIYLTTKKQNENDASEQASENNFKSIPLSNQSNNVNNFIKTLQKNKVVQPEFLLPRTSDISKLNINDLFKDLPSIDEIKDQVGKIFNMNEIKKKSSIISNIGNMQSYPHITTPTLDIPSLGNNFKILPETDGNIDIFRLRPLNSPLLLPNNLNSGLNMKPFTANLPNLQAFPIKPIKLGSMKKINGDILGASLSFPELDSHLEKLRSTILNDLNSNKGAIINQSKQMILPKKKSDYVEKNNSGKLPLKQAPMLGLFSVPTLRPLELPNKKLATLPPSIPINNLGSASQSISPYNKALLMNVLTNTKFIDPIITKSRKTYQPDSLSNFDLPLVLSDYSKNKLNFNNLGQPTKFVLKPLESQDLSALTKNSNVGISSNLGHPSPAKTVVSSKSSSKMLPRKKPIDLKSLIENDEVKSNNLQTSTIPLKNTPLQLKKTTIDNNNNLKAVKKPLDINKLLTKSFESKLLESQYLAKNMFNYPSTLLTDTLHNNPLFALDKNHFAKPLGSHDIISSLSKQLASSPLFKPRVSRPKIKSYSKDLHGAADTKQSTMHNNILENNLNKSPLVNSQFKEGIPLRSLNTGNFNTGNSDIDVNSLDMNSANTCESPLKVSTQNNDNYEIQIDNDEASNVMGSDIIPSKFSDQSAEYKNECKVDNTDIEKDSLINDLTNTDKRITFPYMLKSKSNSLINKMKEDPNPTIYLHDENVSENKSLFDNESNQSSFVNVLAKESNNIPTKNIFEPVESTYLNNDNAQTSNLVPYGSIEISSLEKPIEGNGLRVSENSLIDDESTSNIVEDLEKLEDNDCGSTNNIKKSDSDANSQIELKHVPLLNKLREKILDTTTSDLNSYKPKFNPTAAKFDNFHLVEKGESAANSNSHVLNDLANKIRSSLHFIKEINKNQIVDENVGNDFIGTPTEYFAVTENSDLNAETFVKPLKKMFPIKDLTKSSLQKFKDNSYEPIKNIVAYKTPQFDVKDEDSLLNSSEQVEVIKNQNLNTKIFSKPLNLNALKDLISSKQITKPVRELFKVESFKPMADDNTPEDSVRQSEQESIDSLVEPTQNVAVTENPNMKTKIFGLKDLILSKKTAKSSELLKDKTLEPIQSKISQLVEKDESVIKCPENVEVTKAWNTNAEPIIASQRPFIKLFGDTTFKPNIFESTLIDKETHIEQEDSQVDLTKNVAVTENVNTQNTLFADSKDLTSSKKTIKPTNMNFQPKENDSVKIPADKITQDIDNIVEPTENFNVKEISDNSKSVNNGNILNYDEYRYPVFDGTVLPSSIETTNDECTDVALAASDNLPTSLCQQIEGSVSYKCKLVCTKE